MKTIVREVRFLQRGTLCFGDLYIEDGYLERIDYKTPKPHSDIAVNGFVDLHTHGLCGIATANQDSDALRALAKEYAKRGTVGFAATLGPMSFSEYEAIFAAYRKAFQGDPVGARCYGIHLEGPYLNPRQVGEAQHSALMEIELSSFEEFIRRNYDIIRIVDIAPELAHAQETVAMLARYGIRASIAHTQATYEQGKQALAWGMHQVTHLCMGMQELNHHQEGLMDALIESNCLCELNMDGVHVQRPMLKWLISLLGAERIMAISDGNACGRFYDPQAYAQDKENVAGGSDKQCGCSYCDLLDAFQFLYCDCHLPLADCVKMTSVNAGRLLNTLNYEIDLGKKADVAILDHNAQLKGVIINGRHSL